MLTATDVAIAYATTAQTIRRLTDKGLIPYKKVGRRFMYDKDELPRSVPAAGGKGSRQYVLELSNLNQDSDRVPEQQPTEVKADPLTKARIEKEQALAKLKTMEALEQEGELVRIREVEKEAFQIARQIRDDFLNIPQKIAAELACETDPHRVELLLANEIKRVLKTLADRMERGRKARPKKAK